MTSRGPLTLAALASAAVPGLDPDTVQGVVASGPTDAFEVAFIQDREHRRWVIRCPRTPAASALLERSAALLAVLARRLTMPVPAVKGWVALPEGGRAAVHSYLTGRLVGLEGIAPGSALARGLGRALAHLHNLDPSIYEEAGVPVYDAAGYRSRRLAELDRAAATGRVPTGLLGRWERVLDDETLWSFTATPTHGDLSADSILATPDDGEGPDVKAFLCWESAQVADPADDIAPLLAVLDAEAFDTVMEAYAHTRVERPDRNLHRRAEVIGEMQLVRTMMSLVAAGDDEGAEACAARLRRLDERIARDEDEAARVHGQATKGAGGAAAKGAAGSAVKGVEGTATGAAGTATKGVEGAATSGATTTGASGATTTGSAGAATGGAGGTTETQPLVIRTGEGSSTQTTPSDDASAGTSGDEDDAVQVEHPAKVTRVAPVADASDDDTDAPDATQPGASGHDAPTPSAKRPDTAQPASEPGTSTPEQDDTATGTSSSADAEHDTGGDQDGEADTGEPDTNPALRAVPDPAGDDPTPTSTPTAGRARGNDHDTAEIVALDDDDGDDDVVPPRPRP